MRFVSRLECGLAGARKRKGRVVLRTKAAITAFKADPPYPDVIRVALLLRTAKPLIRSGQNYPSSDAAVRAQVSRSRLSLILRK